MIRNVTWAPPARRAVRAGARAATPRPPRSRCARPGINVTLAPVADVPLGRRRGDGRARVLARPARASRRPPRPRSAAGWRAASQPTAKHFPGLGGATVNTDFGSATIGGGAPTDADLAPFKAAIAAKVPIVMSSHAVYPRLDARHIASQSPAILKDLLRDAARLRRAS